MRVSSEAKDVCKSSFADAVFFVEDFEAVFLVLVTFEWVAFGADVVFAFAGLRLTGVFAASFLDVFAELVFGTALAVLDVFGVVFVIVPKSL